jgi:hypothetical protein
MNSPHAVLIQRAWRKSFSLRTTPRIVSYSRSIGITSDYAKSERFDKLQLFLRKESTRRAGKACLNRILLLSTKRHRSKANLPAIINEKVFLVAFTLAHHPCNIFEAIGAPEKALIDAASLMVTSFEKICNHLTESKAFSKVPKSLTADFPHLLSMYLERFSAWKRSSPEELACRIKRSLIQTYEEEKKLPPTPDQKVADELRAHIGKLRAKLLRIIGRSALEEFDKQCAKDKSKRTAAPQLVIGERVAHELLLDPGFQFQGCDAMEALGACNRIGTLFEDAFWACIVHELRVRPIPYFRGVLRVLSEIREGIKSINKSFSLDDSMDIDFIGNQAEKGLYTFDSCMALMDCLVSEVCSAQEEWRKKETEVKWAEIRALMTDGSWDQAEAISGGLQFLVQRINATRLDIVNATLRRASHTVATQGVDYARKKFQEKLDSGKLGLERTMAWFRPAPGTNAVEAHRNAVLSLVVSGEIREDTIPETLLLDLPNLAKMQAEFGNIVLAAAMMNSVPAVTLDHASKIFENGADAVDDIISEIECTLAADEVARARSCKDPRDAVRQLMRQRVAGMLIRQTAPNPQCATRHLLPRIRTMADRLARIIYINQSIHGPTYSRIMQGLYDQTRG